MAAYCTIPAAKAQLLATLQARPGLTGVLVQWGLPSEVPAERERVYINDAINVQRVWGQIGRNSVAEAYTLQLIVEVFQEGDDQQATEARMWEIVAEIELAAINDVTLAGILRQWAAKPGALNPKCLPTGDGWLAFVTVNLDCKARIQPS